MNERERVEFDIIVGHLYKNLGDDMVRKLRPGLEYYRGIENGYAAIVTENETLKSEVHKLKAQMAYYVASSASTTEIPAIKCAGEGGTGKCRKSQICTNWEPEPQTPGEMSGKRGAALERDEDKHPTDRLDTVGEKKSFFSRLFGG